jgi:hypothetical protein
MGVRWRDGGYSTHVEIYLRVNGEMIPLSQIGPHALVTRESQHVPRGPAQLLLRIDGIDEWQDVVVTASDSSAREVAYF